MKFSALMFLGIILAGCATDTVGRTKSPAQASVGPTRSPLQAPVFVSNIMVGQEIVPLYDDFVVKKTARPYYPFADRKSGIEGNVTVGAVVGANGRVSAVFVVKADAPRDMQSAAMAAVRKWRFAPIVKDGKRIRYAAEVPIEFRFIQ